MEKLPLVFPQLHAVITLHNVDPQILSEIETNFPNLILEATLLNAKASLSTRGIGHQSNDGEIARCLALHAFKRAQALSSKEKLPLGMHISKTNTGCYLSIQSHSSTVLKVIDAEAYQFLATLAVTTLYEYTAADNIYGKTKRLEVTSSTLASKELSSLLTGDTDKVFPFQKNLKPEAIFPGSWSPLTKEHMYMCTIAEAFCESSVYFECSLENVNHAPLDLISAEKIIEQFRGMHLVVTNAPTFIEKAKLFPGTTFIVGMDTWLKIIDPSYYQIPLTEVIRQFKQCDVDFLVFGRKQGDKFITLTDSISYGLAAKVPQHIFCDNPDDDFGSAEQLKQGLQKTSYNKKYINYKKKNKKKPVTGL